MENFVQTFRNEVFSPIRAIKIDGEPFFLSNDIVSALHFESYGTAIKKSVKPFELLNKTIYLDGHETIGTFINQFGTYSLIMDADVSFQMGFYHWFHNISQKIKNFANSDTIYVFTFEEMELIKGKIFQLSFLHGCANGNEICIKNPVFDTINGNVKKPSEAEHLFSTKEISHMFGVYPPIIQAISDTYLSRTKEFGTWIDLGNSKYEFFYNHLTIPIFEYFVNVCKGFYQSDILGFDF